MLGKFFALPKCFWLPWHKLAVNKRWKGLNGYQVKCSCGKLYAMHDGAKSICLWDNEFETMYQNEEILKTREHRE